MAFSLGRSTEREPSGEAGSLGLWALASRREPRRKVLSRIFSNGNHMLTTEQEVNIKKLATMIRVIKVAMLTTLGPDGILRCRPMATQEAEFDGSLWFSLVLHTCWVGEDERDQAESAS